MTAKINFFGKELNSYKANLHTHSTTSDGLYSMQEVVDLYRAEGYNMLAATDHRFTNEVSKIDAGDLLLISGMEFHPIGPRNILLHLLALNIPEDFANPSDLPYQEAIDRVIDADGKCILAHPYWSGLNSSDIMQIKNLTAMEVYNTSTRYIGKAYNMEIWDNMLQLGYWLPAIAVDDTHRTCDFFRGWTMVCARENTVPALMEALKNGSFYASQGPVIHQINFKDNVFSIECSPCQELIVIGDCHIGLCGNVPDLDTTDIGSLKKGGFKEVTSYTTEIPNDIGLTYIRCQLRDKAGNYAWSSPIKLENKQNICYT